VEVKRTEVCKIVNIYEVEQHLDRLGVAASKLWNVAVYRSRRIWENIGIIPDESELKEMLKSHVCYDKLHSFNSQKVLEEVSDAYDGWFELRKTDNSHNPPGYRKNGDSWPLSTVTWKNNDDHTVKHHPDEQVLELSDENWGSCIKIEYSSRKELHDIDQVRAVHDDGWKLHVVYEDEVKESSSPGDRTAGIDLGVENFLAISFGDETRLYPGNQMKENIHYAQQIEYECEGSNGWSNRAIKTTNKITRRKNHFLHALSKHIVELCGTKNVGELVVGDLTYIREGVDWGRHKNKKLHSWCFSKFIGMLEYKCKKNGVTLTKKKEYYTSKGCCNCGYKSDSNRVERGLLVCQNCGLVGNDDVNASENLRSLIQNPTIDMDNGLVASPGVYLFDESDGIFVKKELIDCKQQKSG